MFHVKHSSLVLIIPLCVVNVKCLRLYNPYTKGLTLAGASLQIKFKEKCIRLFTAALGQY